MLKLPKENACAFCITDKLLPMTSAAATATVDNFFIVSPFLVQL
jgi:hypothetical protein